MPVTVTGTKFQSGATLSVGPGVTVTGVAVPSQTQLTATLQIAVDAPVGARDVVVTNPGGGSATLTGGFGVDGAGGAAAAAPAAAWRDARVERQGAGPGRAHRGPGRAGRAAGRDPDGDGDGRAPGR